MVKGLSENWYVFWRVKSQFVYVFVWWTSWKTKGKHHFCLEKLHEKHRALGISVAFEGPPSTSRTGRRMSKRLHTRVSKPRFSVDFPHNWDHLWACLIFWVTGLNMYKPSPVMVGVWHWHVGSMIHHFVHCCLMNGMAHTSVAHRRCRRMRTTASSNVTWRGRQWGLAILAYRKQCGVTCPKNVEKSQWKLFMTPWYSIPNAIFFPSFF